jgi:hypothetical protein
MFLIGTYFREGFLHGGERARTETTYQGVFVMCDHMSNSIPSSCEFLKIVFARRTFILQ